MYKKNPLGIYVYPNNIYVIDDFNWENNSINKQNFTPYEIYYSRFINKQIYGVYLFKFIRTGST